MPSNRKRVIKSTPVKPVPVNIVNVDNQEVDYETIADDMQKQKVLADSGDENGVTTNDTNDNTVDTDDDTNKAKPGRPPIKPGRVPLKKEGILLQPKLPENVIELTYGNPTVFKRLFALLKSMNIKELHMEFTPTGMKFITEDHYKKNIIEVLMDGSKLHSYYCKQTTEISISSKEVSRIMDMVDKSFVSISWVVQESSVRSNMTMLLCDAEMEVTHVFDIELIVPKEINYEEFNDANYPIKLEMSSRYFKKIINDISALSTNFSIEKHGTDKLCFSYEANKLKYQGIYKNADLIRLTSNLTEDDLFSVSIKIDNIKPLSSSLISDTIQISASLTERLLCKGTVDNGAVVIKVWTTIINARNV